MSGPHEYWILYSMYGDMWQKIPFSVELSTTMKSTDILMIRTELEIQVERLPDSSVSSVIYSMQLM